MKTTFEGKLKSAETPGGKGKIFGCSAWRKIPLLERPAQLKLIANKYLNETVLHPSVRFGLAFDTYDCIGQTLSGKNAN